LLVLEAAFAALRLERMGVSKAALREGVLHDMLGRGGADDPRDASVLALMQRYGIDAAQAGRVASTAAQLFERVSRDWQLDAEDRGMLVRAARLHELGLAIAHSQYQVHGAYVLQHSDIAGFSVPEQRVLATLVRSHRRRIPKSAFEMIPDRLLPSTRRLSALLRLAVLLCRSHEAEDLPDLRLDAEGGRLALSLPARWLDTRPLLRADLADEPEAFAPLGIELRLSTH
jgi:exopolyphosphatase/guanosine-5'-triphosphate,3'-diphosphate pyrophosphatase